MKCLNRAINTFVAKAKVGKIPAPEPDFAIKAWNVGIGEAGLVMWRKKYPYGESKVFEAAFEKWVENQLMADVFERQVGIDRFS